VVGLLWQSEFSQGGALPLVMGFYLFLYLLANIHFHKKHIKHYKTVCIDNKMSRPMTALTDINLRAYTNIKHKT